jgi:[ribosomal protein S5]-alanine N-acetyltransferase
MDNSHFSLTTNRLRLIPLDWEELKLCRGGRHVMEAHLDLNTTCAVMDAEISAILQEALEIMIQLVEEDEENYLWNTSWEIVLEEESRIIGGFCFQGAPDSRGEVQIGYVLQPEYRGKGYMTEALAGALTWAFEEHGVSAVIAETEKANSASSSVLKKIGMALFRETENTFWWKRVNEDSPPEKGTP